MARIERGGKETSPDRSRGAEESEGNRKHACTTVANTTHFHELLAWLEGLATLPLPPLSVTWQGALEQERLAWGGLRKAVGVDTGAVCA